jgi:hypothetical protein
MNFSSVEILNLISQISENRWSNVGNKHETYHFTYSNYALTDLNHYAQSINLYLNRQFFGIDIYLKWSILWSIKVLISKLLINKSTVCITSKFIDRILKALQSSLWVHNNPQSQLINLLKEVKRKSSYQRSSKTVIFLELLFLWFFT